MAKAGATVPEICAITGHSLKDAQAILQKHYLGHDPAIARNAIRKMEEENIRRSTLQTKQQTGDNLQGEQSAIEADARRGSSHGLQRASSQAPQRRSIMPR